MRMMFAAIVAALLAAPMPLAAQQSNETNQAAEPNMAAEPEQPAEPEVDITRNGDWEVACQDVERDGSTQNLCEMRQVLVQKDTDQEWLRIAISYAQGADQPVLRIFTPLGVLLQPGMKLRVDGSEPISMQYAVCLARPQRCLVAGPMDNKLIELMKRGIEGQITFVLPNNREINAPFSLAGFTKSLASLPK